MARFETTRPVLPETRIEREVERERNEHSMNHDAKAYPGVAEEDERHKDARETSFSSTVRR
ncbi:MAG: hypothetical protein JWQ01_238 [Massilia sp.]|jgi:hypothetical protein|nr:hypothetical protein [Massilia sp.]